MDAFGIEKLVASTLPETDRPVYAIDTSTIFVAMRRPALNAAFITTRAVTQPISL